MATTSKPPPPALISPGESFSRWKKHMGHRPTRSRRQTNRQTNRRTSPSRKAPLWQGLSKHIYNFIQIYNIFEISVAKISLKYQFKCVRHICPVKSTKSSTLALNDFTITNTHGTTTIARPCEISAVHQYLHCLTIVYRLRISFTL